MHEDQRVFLFVTEYQKTDLYGSTFMGNADPGTPTKIALKDSNPPKTGWRDSPSIFPNSDGHVFVAFVDGRTAAKGGRSRFTVLAPDLSQKLTDVFDVSAPDVQVLETKVVALGPGRAMVASLESTGTISGVTLNCPY